MMRVPSPRWRMRRLNEGALLLVGLLLLARGAASASSSTSSMGFVSSVRGCRQRRSRRNKKQGISVGPLQPPSFSFWLPARKPQGDSDDGSSFGDADEPGPSTRRRNNNHWMGASSFDDNVDPYPDRRPRKFATATTTATTPRGSTGAKPSDHRPGPRWTWDVHHASSSASYQPNVPTLPCTLQEVTDDIVEALEGAWTWRSRRTGGDGTVDGRVGVEVDGASDIRDSNVRSGGWWRSEGEAMRAVALGVAIKLSRRSDRRESDNIRNRPVVVYFNTIQQTLRASGELRNRFGNAMEDCDDKYFDDDQSSTRTAANISLQCLTQDPTLPPSMMGSQTSSKRAGPFPDVDPARGVCIVVQPSDYNHEHRPPGPTLGAAEALQKLCARASLEGIPVVVLSPRFGGRSIHVPDFGVSSPYQDPSISTEVSPPWILRDFCPPVYSWVALKPESSSSSSSSRSLSMVMKGFVERRRQHGATSSPSTSPPALAWHFFARQPCWRSTDRDSADALRRRNHHCRPSAAPSLRHRYLASASYVPAPTSSTFTGAPLPLLPQSPPPPYRPPSSLLTRVWEEFGTVVVVPDDDAKG